MKYDYILNVSYGTELNGLTVEMDVNNVIKNWQGFGNYAVEIDNCKTLEQLRDYLVSHIDEVQEHEYNCVYTNKELFDELIEIIEKDNLRVKV